MMKTTGRFFVIPDHLNAYLVNFDLFLISDSQPKTSDDGEILNLASDWSGLSKAISLME